jgi:serine/threonine-protein kinase
MLSDDGYIKLMDFGIARIEESNRLTKVNHVIGTTAYMAPEILKGANPSVASDLYAVGIVACELLTGKTPFDSATDASMINQILYKDPLIKIKTRSGTEKNLIRIIKKLLSKNPAKRFSSAQALLKELQDMGGIYTRIKMQATISNVQVLSGYPHSKSNYLSQLKEQLEKFSFTGFEQFGRTTEGRIILGSLLLALIIFVTSIITGKLQDSQIVETKMPESTIDARISLSDHEIQNEIPQYLNSNNDETLLEDPDTTENQSETNLVMVDKKKQPKSTPKTIDKPAQAPPLNAVKEEVQEKENNQLLVSNPDSSNLQTVTETETQEKIPHPSVVSSDQPESLTIKKASGQKSEIISLRIPEQFITAAFTSQISSDRHQKNDIVYLQNQNPVRVDGHLIIDAGARIKAVVRESYSLGERARASLAIEFVAVESIDGTWLDLQYPLYSNKGKDEVVFMKGSVIQKLKLKNQSMQLQNR